MAAAKRPLTGVDGEIPFHPAVSQRSIFTSEMFLPQPTDAGRAASEGETRMYGVRQVTSIGFVPENGATYIIVAPEGLYLSAFALFRFLRPPLLVPWCDVRVGGEGMRLWSRWYRLELGSAGTITIKRGAYDAIKPHLVSRTSKPNE
jgi:hypothetical protein